MIRMNRALLRAGTILATALPLAAAPAFAQNAERGSTSQADPEDTIVVSGFRQSLAEGRDIKRNATGVTDVIIAEDIAKFPDLNLAESLQRVPGVTITRTRGEGNQISLRGLGPDFTRVQLNGMEALANTSRNRSFEFNAFASELFNRIEVEKSYRASQDEGGIGGTVNLLTAQPFDYDSFELVTSAQLGTNTNAENLDYRLAGLISVSNDTVGALFSIAYSDRVSQGEDVSTFRYRARNLGNADISALPGDIQTALNNADISIPRGNRVRLSTEEQSRLGATGSLQWQPSDSLLFSVNGLYSEYKVDRQAENIQTRGSNSFPTQNAITVAGETTPPTIVNALRINDANELVFGDFSLGNIGFESTTTEADVEFYQISGDFEWSATDAFTLRGMVGYSQSDNQGREDKFYGEQFNDVTLDFEGERRLDPVITYGGGDLTNVADWRAHEIDLQDIGRTSGFFNAKLDGEWAFTDALTLLAGASFKEFSNEGFNDRANNLLRSDWQAGRVDDDITSLGYAVTGHRLGDWVGVNVDEAVAFFNVTRDLSAQTSELFTVDEEILAAYTQLNFEADIGGIYVQADAGVRYARLDRTTRGVLQTASGDQERLVETGRGDWLPAFNLSAEFLPETLFRLGYSKNVTRPPVGQLSPNATIRTDNFQDVVAGNPDLEPFESDNIDVYVEHYFGRTGYISAGYFYKDVKNFITRASQQVTYGSLNLPLDLLQPGQDASTPFTFVSFVNSQDAAIQGFEIAAQADLDFLPGVLSNLGVLANYTYADGTLDYVNLDGSEVVTQSFPGLSEHSANGTLYYETDVWGARASVAYRSDFVTAVEVGLADEDSRGTLGSTFVDASAFWNITDRLKLTVEALNLTNERERNYSDSRQRLTELRRSGTTYFAGVNFRF